MKQIEFRVYFISMSVLSKMLQNIKRTCEQDVTVFPLYLTLLKLNLTRKKCSLIIFPYTIKDNLIFPLYILLKMQNENKYTKQFIKVNTILTE